MAHYDLYHSLGLSRQSSPAELAAELDNQLTQAPADDAGLQDQLSTARAILGDETRRSLYDQRLDDPSAPEIDVVSLRELAALNTGGAPAPAAANGAASGGAGQFQQQAGQFARTAGDKASAASHQVQDSFKQSNILAIAITAVVTAVVVGLAGWALGLFGGGDPYKDAKNMTNEMLEQGSADDLRSWIQENSTYEDRDDVLSTLRLSGDGSFSGMDSLFGGGHLSAGEVVASDQLLMMTYGDLEDIYEEFADEGYSREEVDSMVLVGVADGGDESKGSVLMLERDGDYQIVRVEIF
ncbi:hypothetical protein ACT3SZ_13300 [Corynebacterium sp. AOP40-9SA-29]|uniref:hypothetical protein n=1 Tax=Corynebacterium sp. AOP40-9SA-29 TaxID=3457677 RepID=UPI004034BC6F